MLNDGELSSYFQGVEVLSETVTDGMYQATLLGAVPGNDINVYRALRKPKGKIYAVVAIARTDGEAMTYDDSILVSPLIEGYSPLEYNIFTMGGLASYQLIDGVRYQIIEVEHIDAFSDKRVYIAVTDGTVDDNLYYFDETTGIISVNEDYEGTNILFSLPQE